MSGLCACMWDASRERIWCAYGLSVICPWCGSNLSTWVHACACVCVCVLHVLCLWLKLMRRSVVASWCLCVSLCLYLCVCLRVGLSACLCEGAHVWVLCAPWLPEKGLFCCSIYVRLLSVFGCVCARLCVRVCVCVCLRVCLCV